MRVRKKPETAGFLISELKEKSDLKPKTSASSDGRVTPKRDRHAYVGCVSLGRGNHSN
jgi:hypothetical protein